MTHLGYSDEALSGIGGSWTAKEIDQQPACWLGAQESLVGISDKTEAFLGPLLARAELRIILTGAGTSAFVGSSVAPALSRLLDRQIEAIATTDLVSAPNLYFRERIPTLLVSFARSGNSPESLATVDLAERIIGECYQLIVSCNPSGKLHQLCENRRNALAFLLPEETNDRGFAMTSSFSTMVLAAISIFTGAATFSPTVSRLADFVGRFITERGDDIAEIARGSYGRAFFLGSNIFKGLAREASLKLLELTDGAVYTGFDSPLGVRHGPKAGLDDRSIVFVFMSNDKYTRKYDQDIVSELLADGRAQRVIALTSPGYPGDQGKDAFLLEGTAGWPDLELLFPYIVFAQMFAFHQAVKAGCRPDSPNVSGTVNRVVQGVTIHPFP